MKINNLFLMKINSKTKIKFNNLHKRNMKDIWINFIKMKKRINLKFNKKKKHFHQIRICLNKF